MSGLLRGCLLGGMLVTCGWPLQAVGGAPPGAGTATAEQHDERMAWWREARFGLFIHWGLYAIPAGEWGGRTDHAEWVRHTAHIPVEEYERLLSQFNPVKFDADAWVRLAREAGMKYLVITSKHHDGFCLFDSRQTDFDVMSTPFGRDILAELAEACRKGGVRLCFYHSIMDWHHPDYLPRRDWEQRPSEGADFDRYVAYVKTQLRELLTGYGALGVLWFDGQWEGTWTHERGLDLYNHVRSLQPGIIINNRVDVGGDSLGLTRPGHYAGDFGTPEQQVPPTGLPGVDWETCMTMNDHWGYNRHDSKWKSSRELVRTLVDVVSKGGNFLLNVGPTPEGEFPPESVQRLADIGEWMRVHGEAIYGTQASPFRSLPWGRCTQKAIEANPTRLYLHVFDWPADGRLRVPGLLNEVRQARVLSEVNRSSDVRVARDEDAVVLSGLGDDPPNNLCSVIALDIVGAPDVGEPPTIEADFNEFVDSLDVNIASQQKATEIHYTTDRSVPTIASRLVAGPVRLTENTLVRARTFRDGKPISEVSEKQFTRVVPVAARQEGEEKPGLEYSYYEGEWDRLPDFASLAPVLTGTVSDFEFSPRRQEERFAFRYTGLVQVAHTGMYRFSVASDDGSRLWIGDRLIVDNDGLHAALEQSGSIPLQAGLHPITVAMFERTGGDMLEVFWEGPDLPRQRIPAASLSHAEASVGAGPDESPQTGFTIGESSFLLNGRPFQIRSGEMHAARIPREYWRHRLQMVRAMGCNTVCAYLFWNQHEPRPGQFDFSGQADVAEYCRLAQEAGLWVILRPGPYSCAEWDLGGLPWWLLQTPDIQLRTRDARYLEAAQRYLLRVGQELAPLQITQGGPILMVQVENEYGSYGSDREYIAALRDTLRQAGFDVPLFTCDGPAQLKNDTLPNLFCVVNFGSDPENAFKALRSVRPSGPLMCGEYYPGWFDSWGRSHHTGDPQKVVRDLAFMLEHDASFSIYMVHGGTSFGFSSGANSPPFLPQSTSYDYDAPIDEAGRTNAKFEAIRELFRRHLLPGEVLPEPPAPNPVIVLPEIHLTEWSGLLDHLPSGQRDDRPRPMEMYGQAHGCILYRTELQSGPAAVLHIVEPHDYAQIYLDGRRLAVLDRRARGNRVNLPPREHAVPLDILVAAMGRVNFGPDLHDRKGITERVELVQGEATVELTGWETRCLPLDAEHLAKLRFQPGPCPRGVPLFYSGSFEVDRVGDTFLDMRGWSKGVVWVNGHNLGRYWNIGPQQTLYLPGCWLNPGRNDLLVLDLFGDVDEPVSRGLEAPILDELRPDPFGPKPSRRPDQSLKLEGLAPICQGVFGEGVDWHEVHFEPSGGRYVCLEAISSQGEDPFTTCAELVLLDREGRALSREAWSIAYADSEELSSEDGAAPNVLDGQRDTFWHTEWASSQPHHPHQIVIDLGAKFTVSGFRYLPRQDNPNGRIREFRLFVREEKFPGL